LIYFYRQLLYPAIWKTDLTIFLHQRMDFTPKDRKTGSQKVKRDFVKKSALLYHISKSNARPLSHTKAPYERFVKYNLHHGLSFCFFEDLIF